MSYTQFQHRFWSDGWIRDLNALDRYLFIYLLTNGRASLTGIYELPLDLMASESGIDERDLKQAMLGRLEPKVFYKEGWVIIKNFPKYKTSNSPTLLKGIKDEFGKIPSKIRELAISYGYPIHTLAYNRIEDNRIDKTSEITISQESEDNPPKEKTDLSYRRVFELWGKDYPLHWRANRTEIQAAQNLLKESTLEDLQWGLAEYKKLSGMEFCPVILKPSDLDRKWDNFMSFRKKHGKS